MRRIKPKTRQDLFKHILKMWIDNEIDCINEWCIGDREKAISLANKEYEEYLKLWDQLEK